MTFSFEALKIIRNNTLAAISHLSVEQLHKIPNGFGNNIIWNVGHMVATQQILCYKLSGVDMLLPVEFIDKYKKGSSPNEWSSMEDIELIKQYFTLTDSVFNTDYEANKFKNYNSYTTSAGVILSTIEDAITYNYGHENLHYGIILSLRKLVV